MGRNISGQLITGPKLGLDAS